MDKRRICFPEMSALNVDFVLLSRQLFTPGRKEPSMAEVTAMRRGGLFRGVLETLRQHADGLAPAIVRIESLGVLISTRLFPEL
jgi:hypothetical protein